MRGLTIVFLGLLLAVIAWLWGFGGADIVSRWAIAVQRDTQNAIAGSLRALKTGQPGALASLWGLCFTYGFVHAAGPGHGKIVIGGYGVAARVTARRLSGLAILSSLAQAATAVVFVYAAFWILGWGRAQMTDIADRTLAPLSYFLIAGIGFWLVVRGLRNMWGAFTTQTHDHHHASDGHCDTCGHAHGPSVSQVESVTSWRDAVAIIGVIAVRPCTGAIFLLILTHALGLDWAGVIGAFVMGLGTASFTGLVALAAVRLRESAVAQVVSRIETVRLFASAEILVGLIVVVLSLQLFFRVI